MSGERVWVFAIVFERTRASVRVSVGRETERMFMRGRER